MSDLQTPSDEATTLLRKFAGRFQADQDYMASVMAQYQMMERLDDADLARQLGTTSEMLTRLAMCKHPNPDSARFAEDVRQIASYTNSDASALAKLVRQVNALAQLAEMPKPTTHADTAARPSHLGSGVLAAARDRTDADENPMAAWSEEESTNSTDDDNDEVRQ